MLCVVFCFSPFAFWFRLLPVARTRKTIQGHRKREGKKKIIKKLFRTQCVHTPHTLNSQRRQRGARAHNVIHVTHYTHNRSSSSSSSFFFECPPSTHVRLPPIQTCAFPLLVRVFVAVCSCRRRRVASLLLQSPNARDGDYFSIQQRVSAIPVAVCVHHRPNDNWPRSVGRGKRSACLFTPKSAVRDRFSQVHAARDGLTESFRPR